MKFKEWVEIWLDTYKKPFLKPNGLECLQYCLKHIMPYFGNRELETIKGVEIQQFINSLKDIPNMQNKVRVYLNEILEYAYRNRYIEFNPCLAIKYRVKAQHHREAMSQEQQQLFIKSLENSPHRLLYLTYLLTGARRSELISKESFRPNFANDTILICGTKTRLSYRTIPLFNQLRVELMDIDFKSYYESYTPDRVTKLLRKHCDKIGLTNICVHSLRTTFATRCLEAGVNPKTIQMWLGHSRIDTTMDIYVDGRQIANTANDFTINEIEKFNKKFEFNKMSI